MKKIVVLLIVLLCINGCVVTAQRELTTGGLHVVSSKGFSVILPEGWAYLIPSHGFRAWDGISFSPAVTVNIYKSGIILFSRVPVNKYGVRKHRINKNMTPLEIAEVVIETTIMAYIGVEVLENKTAVIDGHEGFKATLSYVLSGEKRKLMVYGFVADGWFYYMEYMGVKRIFEEDLGAFEEMVKSFKRHSANRKIN